MAKRSERIKKSIVFHIHGSGKRYMAVDNDYPMIVGHGISKSNALSRLKLVIEETIILMKGISP